MEGDSTMSYLSRTRYVINWRKFYPQYIFFHEDELALWLNGMSKNAPSDVFPEKKLFFYYESKEIYQRMWLSSVLRSASYFRRSCVYEGNGACGISE